MFCKRKLYVLLGIAAAVFLLMFASQSVHTKHYLPVALGPFTTWTMSTSKELEDKLAVPLDLTRRPSNIILSDDIKEEEKEEEEEENKEKQLTEESNPRLCGCSESCVSDLEGSEWFSKHYDPQQQPILRANHNFEPDAIKWWLRLQQSGAEQTLEDVMSKMFQVIPPPTVDTNPHPSRCRKCAVIGNSGNLRNSGHGELIDSHSFVIRINRAKTRGFEKDVGNRTTHHIMYPESAVDLNPGVSLILLPFKLRDLEWLTSALSTGEVKKTYMRVKERVNADKDKVLVVNPLFFKYVHDQWTEHHGRYPSTGMLTIVFALHTCDQVSVFGYGADQQGNWHHYWENNHHAGAFRKTGVHSADFETEVIHQLAKEGKISLHL
ncbi:ST3 beta-galactoside alpha-2,3-sialyltransferase 8 [Austrofundulus limnaeus]|uniref:CMP-N-acetylneuraminate-beta-galactosamide-alpha-2,3-sialyltransferase 2 n=1 Tax=Austrofundulus limnaeus TaxID=52670 RepID=A0A2I4BUV6_AUSLI|nr:PREDICTED: CMP-N-acetylneuraminate-beta-galactosamide-alpha-2,3-sialyltransferase 2-like [Austrofundulus limnaeus]